MARSSSRRDDILNAAALLFRRQGYANTGVNEILEMAQAPKGSLYHYFPDGKEEIGVAAMKRVGAAVTAEIVEATSRAKAPEKAVMTVARGFAKWLEDTNFQQGCGIATTLLESGHSDDALRCAGGAALRDWRDALEDCFLRFEIPAARAPRLAAMVIATIEGGLMMARGENSTAPLMDAAEEAAEAVRLARPSAT